MTQATKTPAKLDATHQQLKDHAAGNARRGILIQVDSINADGDVAFCSVEQKRRGLLLREFSVTELTWRAEQALSPLIQMGILPLITVRHKDLFNTRSMVHGSFARSIMNGITVLTGWLGLSQSREGFTPIPVATDPFGWKVALARSRAK